MSTWSRIGALCSITIALAGCRGTKTTDRPAERGSTLDASATQRATAIVDEGDAGPGISPDEICERTPVARVNALPGAKPFTDLDPHCGDKNPFCDRVEKTPDASATCFVADDNITRAERESRAAHGPAPSTSSEWDGVKPPKYLDRIDAHLHLTAEEREKLRKNRFVVLDRLAFTDYASAFHEVFQEQLPLFVGIDPIVHAVFRGTELALERIERKRLLPALGSMLKKLRATLAASAAGMRPETRDDIDVYLGVASALFSPPNDKDKKRWLSTFKSPANELAIRSLYESATGERELKPVELFGRTRMIDFSQLEPRGHYVSAPGAAYGEPELSSYFQAMMWLSRVELNLVSRSSQSSNPAIDPSETPRETRDALALVELLERSGAMGDVRAFDEVYTTFAGRREDVSPAKLLELSKGNAIRSSDPGAPDKLKTAIGQGFRRTARTHFTPEGAPDLPVIFTLFGPRIVPDVAPLTRVVHDEVPERKWLAAADAGYLLGHDRARAFIRDFDKYPDLDAKFADARAELRKNAAAANDVYGRWLRAILTLGAKPEGVVPSFVKTDAYADHRLNSALVGYGQLRHAFVLLSAQAYDAYGCEIPDAYVEPLPAVYDALVAHVAAMRSQTNGWAGLERVLRMLATIAHDETAGRLLTEPQRRWLAMVSEHIPNGGFTSTGEPPKWTGWYFDMFEDRQHGATKRPSFIADYFTLTNAGEVAYLGAEGPRLAVFIVDTNGEPRAMVGPVAKGFEAHAPISGRLSDDKVFEDGLAKSARWRDSYAVAAKSEPPLGLEGKVVYCGAAAPSPTSPPGFGPMPSPSAPAADAGPKPVPKPNEWRVAMRSTRARAGLTTVTLLDHHADALTTKVTVDVDREWKVAVFDLPPELARSRFGVEALHVRIEDLARSRTGTGPFDYTTTPTVFRGVDYDAEEKMPTLPRGPSFFTIGAAALPSSAGPSSQ